MNVLLLSQFFSTTRGGGEYIFSLIARNLARNGHKVFVITNRISGESYPEEKNVTITFVEPTLEYRGGLPPGFSDNVRYFINAARAGMRIIKKEKIDVIHSNNFAPALAGSMLSALTSRPHITTVHDIFSLCGKNYWKEWGRQSDVSRLNVLLAPFFEKLMLRLRHDCTHTVSEATKEDLLKFGERKPIHVIPNAIEDGPTIDAAPNPRQFAYVGRLVFYKNLEVAIRAVAIAKDTEPAIRLVVIGGGPHRRTLEDMARTLGLENNVEFKGYVTPEEKARAIAESAALVFPSLCEGFGLVMLEAFLQRRPVLVSDIRPMSDIITHGKNGFILDPHDEKKWADRMLELARDPKEASRMGQDGNQLLKTSYGQESMYQKIIGMYEGTVQKRDY